MSSDIKSRKGFTLVELLVVIVIIGILATLATVALNSSRAKARDAKRISDIKQLQTALELYFSDENGYPSTAAVVPGSALTSLDGTKTFMSKVPSNPGPRIEGACTTNDDYSYSQDAGGLSYVINYCLAKPVNELAAGTAVATPRNINTASAGGGAAVCTPTKGQACPSGATVNYNGVTYNTVWMDYNGDCVEDSGECWLKENLATAQKPDGTSLSHSTGGYMCPPNIGNTAEDCTVVTNNGTSGSTSVLGYVYTWATAMNLSSSCNTTDCSASIAATNHQGICPSGWHIPGDMVNVNNEWSMLAKYAENTTLGITTSTCSSNCTSAAKALKETGTNATTYIPWAAGNVGTTNALGFSLRGAGYYYTAWDGRGGITYLWSAGQSGATYVYSQYNDGTARFQRMSSKKTFLFSVRCVKN